MIELFYVHIMSMTLTEKRFIFGRESENGLSYDR